MGRGRQAVSERTARPRRYARYYDYHGGHRINRSKQFRTQRVAREWVKRHNAQKHLREIGEVVPVPMSGAVREFVRGCSTLAEDTITHYLSGLAMFERVPGYPRSIRLLAAREDLPDLE